jgi:hypothetical protein
MEASAKLAEAAKPIGAHRAALEIRRLQTIPGDGAERNSATVLMIPGEFLSAASAFARAQDTTSHRPRPDLPGHFSRRALSTTRELIKLRHLVARSDAIIQLTRAGSTAIRAHSKTRGRNSAMSVNTRSLQLGDILITSADNTVSHCGIVGGTTSVNAASGRVDRADMIYHATSKGIKLDEATGWVDIKGGVDVFRKRGLGNLTVGGKPAAKVIADAASKLAARCHYSPGRAIFKSWTGTSDYGSSAKGRVKKYLDRLGADGQFTIAVYCSEFVVLSYQLAAKGDEHVSFFIELDGKHTLPKDLRNWLLQRATAGGTWQVLGKLVN